MDAKINDPHFLGIIAKEVQHQASVQRSSVKA